MRRSEIFFDGVTHIREDLIEEAQRYVFRRRINWRRYAGGSAEPPAGTAAAMTAAARSRGIVRRERWKAALPPMWWRCWRTGR